MNDIKISVLVPVYGVETFIERCARSLFEQTMTTGIEYVFVNDCTKDRSIEILERVVKDYPDRAPFVKIIHHETNKKLAATRNTSIDHASGEYVCFVDSDDYVEVEMLQTLYNKAIETDSDIVSSNFFMDYGSYSLKCKGEELSIKEECFKEMVLKPFLWGRIYKRYLFEKHNIRVLTHLTCGQFEDFSATPRLSYYAKKIHFTNDFLYHYIQYNTQSYSKQKVTINDFDILVNIIKSHNDFFKDKDPVYGNIVKFSEVMYVLSFFYYFAYILPLQKKVSDHLKTLDCDVHYPQLSLERRIIYILAKNDLLRLLNILIFAHKTYRKLKTTWTRSKTNS